MKSPYDWFHQIQLATDYQVQMPHTATHTATHIATHTAAHTATHTATRTALLAAAKDVTT